MSINPHLVASCFLPSCYGRLHCYIRCSLALELLSFVSAAVMMRRGRLSKSLSMLSTARNICLPRPEPPSSLGTWCLNTQGVSTHKGCACLLSNMVEAR